MKVINYLKSVPSGNTNAQKEEIFKNFHKGVEYSGDKSILHNGYNLVDCDVALIQGWVYSDTTSKHLQLRKQIIDTQKQKNKFTIIADANLFLYSNKLNPHGYLRYSLNGVFPNTGIYCDDTIDKTRWDKISKNCSIKLEDYRTSGNHILILLQRQGGWSMGNEDVIDWTNKTIKKIRKAGCTRTIKIRPHPGCKKSKLFLESRSNPFRNLKNVLVCDPNNSLQSDLHKCFAVVNKNSSGIVGPIIQGYHSFITDPEHSQCAQVSNLNFANIENPQQFDRLAWLQRISMFHWNFKELESGEAWQHIKNYV